MKRILLLSYLSLCAALVISNGFYDRLALLFVTTSFVLLLYAAWQYLHGREDGLIQSFELPLVVSLLFSLGCWFVKPTGMSSYLARYEHLAMAVAGLAIIGTLCLYLLRRRSRIRRVVFFIMAIMPVILWFLLPWASPQPRIDVYKFHQSAASYLASGVNPYSVILGTASHYDAPSGYLSPPAVLYPLTFSFLLVGDVRYGQAVLMGTSAFLLWLVARRMVGGVTSELIPLLFLYHPRGIYVLDHSWTETVIIFPLALFVFLSVYKSLPAVTAFVYGCFLSLKPYLAFLLLPWLIMERRLRYLLIGLLGFVVPIIPFVASDFTGTIYNGFFFVVLHAPFRSDSLSISSLLFDLYGYRISLGDWSLFVGATVAVLTFWFLRKRPNLVGYLYAAVITMLSVFLFGAVAFCGYYYFISVMMLFLIAMVNQRQSNQL